jgi:hypothetical protein
LSGKNGLLSVEHRESSERGELKMNNEKRNITDKDMQHGGQRQQGQRGTETMQRSRMERGEINNQEIDDDAMIDEATQNRSDLGAGE